MKTLTTLCSCMQVLKSVVLVWVFIAVTKQHDQKQEKKRVCFAYTPISQFALEGGHGRNLEEVSSVEATEEYC